MKPLFWILFLLFVFAVFQAEAQIELPQEIPYYKVERIVLQDSVENINLRDYMLADYGSDSIVVFTKDYTDNNVSIFNFRVYGKNGSKGSLVQIHLKKPENKYVKIYSIFDFTFYRDQLFLLFTDRLWVLPFSQNEKPEYFDIYSFAQPYSSIVSNSSGIFAQRCKIVHDGIKLKDKVVLSKLEIKDNELWETPLDSYTPDNYFLMYFESRQYYAIDPMAKIIVKLYCDKPKFDILNFDGALLTSHDMEISWKYFDPEEVVDLNKKSDRDPNLVFDALNDRFTRDVFLNARIDFIGPGRFLISSSIPDDSLKWNQKISLYENKTELVDHVFTQPAVLNRLTDGLEGRDFVFPNNAPAHYFFESGKRYQLAMTPHFDPSLTDVEKIKRQQEYSFTQNRFELCLYSGELRR